MSPPNAEEYMNARRLARTRILEAKKAGKMDHVSELRDELDDLKTSYRKAVRKYEKANQ